MLSLPVCQPAEEARMQASCLEWNYDEDTVTQWKRVGECNQCGDCCKTLINIKMVSDDIEADKETGVGFDGTDEEGVWSEIEGGADRKFIQFTASLEGKEDCIGLCLNECVYNGNKPWVCKIWPTIPNDIKLFPNCSYEFEDEGQWEIADTEEVNQPE
jgi:Fe-S-cluster containining protein